MANRYTYYAVVDERYTREEPFAVVRREPFATGGGYDEDFSRGTDWGPTSLLMEAEHGDTRWDFVEVDEAEANRLVEYFRSWRASRDRQPKQ